MSQKDLRYIRFARRLTRLNTPELFEGAWSNSNSKSFTAALFTHKESGKDFIAIGTHLWWKSESAQAGSDNARLEQAELIIAQAREMLGSYDVPVFVISDARTRHASRPYEHWTLMFQTRPVRH